jgi:hypothetical protein
VLEELNSYVEYQITKQKKFKKFFDAFGLILRLKFKKKKLKLNYETGMVINSALMDKKYLVIIFSPKIDNSQLFFSRLSSSCIADAEDPICNFSQLY